MLQEILKRRSIRKFSSHPIPEKDIREIIECGMNAPSSKNRQPWSFVVVQGDAKQGMLQAFQKGIDREEHGAPLLPNSRQHLSGAKYTLRIMEQAPVTIFVFNTLGDNIFAELSQEERVFEICNHQSVSAAIQNILLAATAKKIGSLWICDIYFAYQELCDWLNIEGELLAAVSLGYPEESPPQRPKKNFDDLVIWKNKPE
ncbi:nitroreductase family protein [Clostridium facile]|uniref:Nitroreductase family protein n=1 Tax=Clostridium facile TaxID=2763035 RepID=A0ABR7IPV3_9CLOT|nr:nitroreductase family protein [Clostridium facile]MBC5787164.1 nitroreductase family protein [Clostridium facile]